ncbi:hypothetical protein BGZ61DRAFT_465822 [Ilyonectria robusta]|uniref:uncharacterized protein n=1 Tax=Ilyonectria robusta TaxID=1079257 RepID=UPI001E8EB634|nr:uncharacterized protein BGZ61DRAFT_465822 [Ilyonectria robusta]KAH8658602.1 hypothetical protein BGZ61DRAFT_465822 [Ilyonectria robusta]
MSTPSSAAEEASSVISSTTCCSLSSKLGMISSSSRHMASAVPLIWLITPCAAASATFLASSWILRRICSAVSAICWTEDAATSAILSNAFVMLSKNPIL